MKVRSFGSLIYREFFLARKNIGSNLFAYLAFSALGLLIYLSFQYGNLAEVEADQESIAMFAYTFPLFMGSGLCISLAESGSCSVFSRSTWHVCAYGCQYIDTPDHQGRI